MATFQGAGQSSLTPETRPTRGKQGFAAGTVLLPIAQTCFEELSDGATISVTWEKTLKWYKRVNEGPR